MNPENESSGLDSALPEVKVVHGYKVQKLPLGAYFSLLAKLDKVPRDFLDSAAKVWGSLEDAEGDEEKIRENNAQAIELVLKGVSKLPDEVLTIIAAACGTTKEDLQENREIGVDGFIELSISVWEVNNLGDVVAKVKKKLPPKIAEYLGGILGSEETGSTK